MLWFCNFDTSVSSFFNEYPVLKQPAEYNLLLKDFEKLLLLLKKLKHIIEKYLSAVTGLYF